MNTDFWNERYAAKEYAYGRHPNVFFAQWLTGQTPGKILLPCDGEGRNAVYAATCGWLVYASDLSTSGYQKAQSLAREQGVEITFVVEDVLTAMWPANQYDAVGLFYAHFPEEQRRQLHAQCVAALKPGGSLVLEAFSKDQIGKVSGGPRQKPILYDPADLREDFSLLGIEQLTSLNVELDEGIYHQGLASVVRLVGRKQ